MVQNLDALFAPTSVAVIGATDRPHAVGTVVWHNLRHAARAFRGPCYAVNPNRTQLLGERTWPDVASLPERPDLGVVCTPPAAVAGAVRDLAARSARAAIVLTAGLDEASRAELLAIAHASGMRILGPNCIGAMAPHAGLNASFAHASAEPGPLAFVTQSGALMTAMLDWSRARNLGFSHFVSLGDQLEVDCADLLLFLADDDKTQAILLYLESVQDSAKFLAAARQASRKKPVLVVKAGRSEAGSRAAKSHTGALAGSDLVFDAAVRRAGLLRVDSVHDLFLAAETLACLREADGERICVLTNGGGAGVLAADACTEHGVPLAELDGDTIARLDALLPANWSKADPVDVLGDAPVERYVRALETLLAREETGCVLFVHAPTAIVDSKDIAAALLPLARTRNGERPRVFSCWLGEDAVREARATFRAAGIGDYDTPEEAVRAFAMLRAWRSNQRFLELAERATDAPKAFDRVTVDALVATAIAEGREWLLEDESKRLLAAAGIPVVATRHAEPRPEAAAAAARELGFPVALKALSPDLLHKSDLGGVALDLGDEVAVHEAASAMLARLRRARPDARVVGFSVQSMIRQKGAVELIVGAHVDASFGPVLLFGHGGTTVELRKDRALALPPLDRELARELVDRTRVARLLDGFRGQRGVDRGAVEDVLVAASQLLAEVPEIAEFDVNPLLASPDGVLALDARVRVSAARPGGRQHFALRHLASQAAKSEFAPAAGVGPRPLSCS